MYAKSKTQSRRWSDIDEDERVELSLEQIKDLLAAVGIPHKDSECSAFSRVKVDEIPVEESEPTDPILFEGLDIGQSNRGRGGLERRLRVGAPRRGGVVKDSPPRISPVCVYSVACFSPLN